MTPETQVFVDIRLMNVLSRMLLALALLLMAAVALTWAVRLPMFNIRLFRVEGDVTHYNAMTLRANVMPRLQGTFFTLDLNVARQAFEAMPWVRQAVVKRDFPYRIKVKLQEHQPVALWGTEGDEGLLNSFGEVFDADAGDIDQDVLPRLYGPQSAPVWATYQTLQPVFAAMNMNIRQLELTPRGSWHAQLDAGTTIELGSGNVTELVARVQRFLKTMSGVNALYKRTSAHWRSVDLRHTDGYAIRLDGVTTTFANNTPFSRQ